MDQICRLAIDHIRLAATVRVIRQDVHSPLIKEFNHYMYTKFPRWKENLYIAQLPAKHKLVLWLLDKKQYLAIKLLFGLLGSK